MTYVLCYEVLNINLAYEGKIFHMEEKVQFGKFIAQKRKDANLTQKELADKLFVTDTTVSKWERGLSYPDITLISSICKVLTISEHEFFTACDDIDARNEKKQARKYRIVMNSFFITLSVLYALTIVICFVCNLAIEQRLSWFFIVLASIALAFSMTCLPVLLKKNKTILTFISATALTYVLEFVICVYASGDWLLHIAYPITTVALLWVWLIMLVVRFVKMNALLKAGLITIICSIITLTMNSVVGYFIGQEVPGIREYLNFTTWEINGLDIMIDGIVFYSLLIIGFINLMIGIIKSTMRKQG
jgi:transcriptional regulator with XRE-family HTH domain